MARGTLTRADYYSGKCGPIHGHLEEGAIVEFLQYRAEGTCFVRSAGRTIDADPCPSERKSDFRLEVASVTETWIHLVVSGKAAGWLRVTNATARIVAREF